MSSSMAPATEPEGFTLIEVLITAFIIGVVVAGMFGLFLLTTRSGQTGERRIVAVALANERMEMVRNLPYVNVGTAGGIPPGAIPQEETVIRNGQSYVVRTDIRYVDDPYDGEVGGEQQEEEKITICHKPGTSGEKTLQVGAPALDAHLAHGDTTGACGSQGEGTPSGDEYNADYKQVRVEVSWPSQYDLSPVLLLTYVAPQGIEGGELGGTLDFQALDAAGVGVSGATLTLVNDSTDPTVNITTSTNEEGRVVLPGLPPGSDSYELSITKDGYTIEQTYDTTSAFLPSPDYAHFSIVAKEVTEKTYFIDIVSGIDFTFQDSEGSAVGGVAYSLRGTKTIGQDDEEEPVYKVAVTESADGTGSSSQPALDWDTYEFTIDGVAEGYDIQETSEVMPFSVSPGETLDVTVTLVDHTDYSLHVTIVDSSGEPVDNTTVQLSGNGFDETQVTGLPGQLLFADLPGSAEYQLDVDAPGFDSVQQMTEVTGTDRVRVELSATTP